MLIFCILPLILVTLTVMIFKSILHPSAILSGVWGSVMILIYFSRSMFNEIKLEIIAYIIIMVSLFCISALILSIAVGKRRLKRNLNVSENLEFVAFIVTIVCLSLLPSYINQQSQNIESGLSILYQIRRNSLDGESGDTLLSNFVLISLVNSMFAFAVYLKLKSWRTALLFSITFLTALAYAFYTGSKIPLLNVVMANSFLFMAMRPKKEVPALVIMLGGGLSVLIAGLFMVNFAGLRSYGTSERITTAALDYIVGGTVAFANNFDEILLFENHQNVQNALSVIPQRLGFDIESRDIHFPWTSISTDRLTNVYTIFFPLIKEYSTVGATIIFIVLGALYGIAYIYSTIKIEVLVMYAILCVGLVGTIFSDSILYGSLVNIKFLLVIFLFMFLSTAIGHLKKRLFKEDAANRSRSGRKNI
ncbi:O-antigen polymerase [Deinococcus sp. YIM 134068]|uniref:O-antigen polymerase n=1 Tax=Deinococcus lichenicola TaxID=3118910 RepID=UPI002F958CEC